jgi:hypothetical protein
LNDAVTSSEDEPALRFERHGWLLVGETRHEQRWERRVGDRVLSRRSSSFDATDSFTFDGIDLRGASSADFDQRGRLIYARNGKVYADGQELADFNAMEP